MELQFNINKVEQLIELTVLRRRVSKFLMRKKLAERFVLLFLLSFSALSYAQEASFFQDVYEPDDSQLTASQLTLGETQFRTSHSSPPPNAGFARNVDWVKVIVPDHGFLDVTIVSDLRRMKVVVFDEVRLNQTLSLSPLGIEQFHPTDGTKTSSSAPVHPGVYYLRVSSFSSGFESSNREYALTVRLRLTALIDDSDEFEDDNWITSASPITLNEIENHNIGSRMDADWYGFRVNGCVKLLTEAASVPILRLNIQLWDSRLKKIGDPLITNRRSDETVESGISSREVRAGIYFVSITSNATFGIYDDPLPYVIRFNALECDSTASILPPIINLLLDN